MPALMIDRIVESYFDGMLSQSEAVLKLQFLRQEHPEEGPAIDLAISSVKSV